MDPQEALQHLDCGAIPEKYMLNAVQPSLERTSPLHYSHICYRPDRRIFLQAVSIEILQLLASPETINVAQHSCCQET